MARPKVSDFDRVKAYLATCDLLALNKVQDLLDFARMVHGGTLPIPKRTRKPKDAAQMPLAKGETQ